MLQKISKLFGEINLTWPKLIIFAIAAGAYTALMALLPIAKNTSFADISISFEVWVLFGIFIIMNSKSPLDSALKCFVFFLISQPLVYIIQVPFFEGGWSILQYYKPWFIWTLFTFPMGFVGYFMKKDKWWGLLILSSMLLLLGEHYAMFLSQTLSCMPYHLLSALFCLITVLLYPLVIFHDKKIRIAGAILSIVIIIAASVIGATNIPDFYDTTLLVNDGSAGALFDNTYTVELSDPSFGTVHIDYEENLEDYLVNAELKKPGKTDLILTAPTGEKQVYELIIKKNNYSIEKKAEP